MSKAAWVDDPVRDLPRLVAAGVTHVALDARLDRPQNELEALAEAGVFVHAVRLRGDLALPDVEARREQLRALQRQVTDAARLGAAVAWLEPVAWESESARVYFDEAFELLAGYARARQVRLIVSADIPA